MASNQCKEAYPRDVMAYDTGLLWGFGGKTGRRTACRAVDEPRRANATEVVYGGKPQK